MISDLSKESWDAKAIELGGSILQSWAWGEFQTATGHKTHRFSGDSYINQVSEFSLMVGKKYLYSARGPLGDFDAALTDLKNFSTDRSIVFTRVEPPAEVDLLQALKDIQPKHNWLLGLAPSEEELLSCMKSKHRYNINLAAKKGVTVRQGTKEDVIAVWQLFLETAGKAKIRLHPQNYYFQMFEHLYPDCLRIFIAEYQGKPLAAMFLTMFGDTATYLHGGSTYAEREMMAPFLMQWEAIKFAKSQGLRHYDFGGIAPENDQNHSWSGISRFKRGFGGFELVTPGAYDLVYSPIWYNVYKNARTLRKLLK